MNIKLQNFINKLIETKSVGVIKLRQENGYSVIGVDKDTTVNQFIKKIKLAIMEENSLENVIIIGVDEKDYGYHLTLHLYCEDDGSDYTTEVNMVIANIY
jgi:hypothetical protein